MISLTCRLFTIAVIAGLLVTEVPHANAAQWQYEAVAGDTPLRICRRFTRTPGCSLALARLNGIPPRAPIKPGTTIRIQAEWLKRVPIVGGVLETSAGAEYQAVDESGYAPVVAGEPVYLGDTIRTGDGNVVLEFLSGLMIEVKPHSRLVLQSMVDRDDDAVVDVDIVQGAASIASSGDSPTVEALAGVNLNEATDTAGAHESALARAERMLAEAPTAAGARPSIGGDTRASSIHDLLRDALALPGNRNALNTFPPARFEWERGPDEYTWEVTLLAVPRRPYLRQVFVVGSPMLSVPDLAPGCYGVEIRAIDEQGTVGRARAESLCVHPALGAPATQEPTAQGPTSGRLAWGEVDHAADYLVEFAVDPAFERTMVVLASADRTIALPPDTAGSRYVRVRARNAAGMDGPPGPVRRLP